MKLEQLIADFEGQLDEPPGQMNATDLTGHVQFAAVLYGELQQHFGRSVDGAWATSAPNSTWLFIQVGLLIEEYRKQQADALPVLTIPVGPVSEKP